MRNLIVALPNVTLRGKALFLLLALLILIPGCRTEDILQDGASVGSTPIADFSTVTETLARGVVHRAIPLGVGVEIDVIDTDLSSSNVVPRVRADRIEMNGGRVTGGALTPAEWQMETDAIAVVNGGYFGAEHSDGTKDVVGLLVESGRVRHAAPPLLGTGSASIRPGYYARSAFGVSAGGIPSITWAGTEAGHSQHLLSFSRPTGAPLRAGSPWRVSDAIGCGPMLFYNGNSVITDRQERLVSADERPRTFVAYDTLNSRPRHFLIGTASSVTYPELAAFLSQYYGHYYGTVPNAAMCVDGGSSTQLTYRGQDGIHTPLDTGVTVPDCITLSKR